LKICRTCPCLGLKLFFNEILLDLKVWSSFKIVINVHSKKYTRSIIYGICQVQVNLRKWIILKVLHLLLYYKLCYYFESFEAYIHEPAKITHLILLHLMEIWIFCNWTVCTNICYYSEGSVIVFLQNYYNLKLFNVHFITELKRKCTRIKLLHKRKKNKEMVLQTKNL
jgi:hypothetical protein